MKIDIYTKFIMTLMAIGLLLIGTKGLIAPAVAESGDDAWQITASCPSVNGCRIFALNARNGQIKAWHTSYMVSDESKWSVYDY